MISDQTRELIVHLMKHRPLVHPQDVELLAGVLARVQAIHVEATTLEHDMGGLLDEITGEDAQEAARRTGA